MQEERLGGDFLVTVSPLHDAAGNLVGSVHVARDFTCCKRAAETMREKEQRFRALIEHSHDAITLIAADGTILYDSPSVARVLGYPSAETAIRGIDMAVDAYLTKPLEIEDLLAHVRKAAERCRARRRMAAVVERLHAVVADLESDRSGPLRPNPEADNLALGTIRTLASCLSDLLALLGKAATDHGVNNLCDLLDCPQRPAHRQVILDAVKVLEKTKDNFRSKQLAELRVKLERSLGGT
jgi:PAS domain S-box-containing protein